MGGTGILPVRLRAGRPYHPKTIVQFILARALRAHPNTVAPVCHLCFHWSGFYRLETGAAGRTAPGPAPNGHVRNPVVWGRRRFTWTTNPPARAGSQPERPCFRRAGSRFGHLLHMSMRILPGKRVILPGQGASRASVWRPSPAARGAFEKTTGTIRIETRPKAAVAGLAQMAAASGEVRPHLRGPLADGTRLLTNVIPLVNESCGWSAHGSRGRAASPRRVLRLGLPPSGSSAPLPGSGGS